MAPRFGILVINKLYHIKIYMVSLRNVKYEKKYNFYVNMLIKIPTNVSDHV